MFFSQKKVVGLKIEYTAYDVETLDVGDFDFRAYNITYTPTIAEIKRKYATCDYDSFTSVMGKQSGTVGFHVDMAPHPNGAQLAPEWGKILQSCGYKITVFGSTGVSYVPHADYSTVTATIEVRETDEGTTPTQVRLLYAGCVGNVNFILDEIGNPLRAEFEFTGRLEAIDDIAFGNKICPTGFDQSEPAGVLASTITAFGEAQALDKVAINTGNQVELVTAPEKSQGVKGAAIVNRESTMQIDPYLEKIATSDHYSRWSGATSGAYSMTVGADITVSAPAIQITKAYGGADRSGITVNTLDMILTRNAGNDSLEILQGSKT